MSKPYKDLDVYEITIEPNTFGGKEVPLILDGIIDLVESVSHNFTDTVTKYPVEDGSIVIDNIVRKPVELRMSVVVSNLFTEHPAIIGLENAFSPPEYEPFEFGDGSIALVEKNNSDLELRYPYDIVLAGRPKASLDELLALRSNKKFVTIKTSLHTYENMVLVSIRSGENVRTGTSLNADLKFVQIEVVKSFDSQALRIIEDTRVDLNEKPLIETMVVEKEVEAVVVNEVENPILDGWGDTSDLFSNNIL